MLLKLFTVETSRLARRIIPWLTLGVCALFIGYNQYNYYSQNKTELLNGDLKMPGFSFDVATSLDQTMVISLPFLVIVAALVMGQDYNQRTNQHWLMRANRTSSILSKFATLVLLTFTVQIIALLAGGGVGWFCRAFVFDGFTLVNVNGWAVLAALFYMTVSTLPYMAWMLVITVGVRSAFAAVAIGLGYTQFIEILLTSALHGLPWMKWYPRNLYLSATYLLNSIGNKTVAIPDYLVQPGIGLAGSVVFTLAFLGLAVWCYRRQDLGS